MDKETTLKNWYGLYAVWLQSTQKADLVEARQSGRMFFDSELHEAATAANERRPLQTTGQLFAKFLSATNQTQDWNKIIEDFGPQQYLQMQ